MKVKTYKHRSLQEGLQDIKRDLGSDARVLVGTCDDLSIPRPLGPIRDLAGDAAPELDDALRSGAPPHDVQTLLLSELEARPHPTATILTLRL